MVAQELPTSSTMALHHGPMGVAEARRRLRKELSSYGVPDPVIDDAVLIISELLSNSCRHARPIECRGPVKDGEDGGIRAGWRIGPDGVLVVEVTDGGGPTRPLPASPSLTAHGGRGLGIVGSLSSRWGVRDSPGEVTVWAALPSGALPSARRNGMGLPDLREMGVRGLARRDVGPRLDVPIDFADPFDDL
jgi:anti-sigma regulatory factor (Ser/Thr protein kinase)